MDVQKITVDRQKAGELFRKYKEHQAYQTPLDAEIQRAYELIAKGRMIIQAVASIKAAGLNESGLPKLAIARADAEQVYWRSAWGRGYFSIDSWARSNQAHSRVVKLSGWDVLRRDDNPDGKAIVPIVPVHLRPKRGLQNYHTLFEAEWTPIPPTDPYLLRRISGDLWMVVAAWELTAVERAAMASRISA